MSDWKVELVNDNINEFYVEFGGPADSAHRACSPAVQPVQRLTSRVLCRPLQGWMLEGARGAARGVPV